LPALWLARDGLLFPSAHEALFDAAMAELSHSRSMIAAPSGMIALS
jgi:hypothetical protein